MNPNEILKKIDIAGNIDDEQESVICLFYSTVVREDTGDKKVKK